MDWGEVQWDVDPTADSLNKSLFQGKKTSGNLVTADRNVTSNNKSTRDVDSDDDDSKLSKKAKKKLKERRRKENKRNKKEIKTTEDDISEDENETKGKKANKSLKKAKKKGNEIVGSEEKKANKTVKNAKKKGKEIVVSEEIKSKKSLKNVKKKENETAGSEETKATKLEKVLKKKIMKDNTSTSKASGPEKFEKSTIQTDQTEGKNKKKRKICEANGAEKVSSPSKQQKTENGSDVDTENEPSEKRKRKKKRKPSSKRNKFKNQNLKPKHEERNLSDSGSDMEVDILQTTSKGSNLTCKEEPKNNQGLKSVNGIKRKNIMSDEKLPSKKMKLADTTLKTKSPKKNNTEQNQKQTPEKGLHLKISKDNKEKKKKTATGGAETKGDGAGKENGLESKGVKGKKKQGKGLSPKSKQGDLLEASLSEEIQEQDRMVQKKKKNNSRKKGQLADDAENREIPIPEPAKSSPFYSTSQGSKLQQDMVDKLASARFRFINEQLYTIKGGEAFRMFQQDKTLKEAYHRGFQGQVKHWPINPLEIIIKQLNTKSPQLNVVDFGCGEAELSANVQQKVHSFDLYALNDRVTVCDMSKTPLASESMNVAVFCLSLMGTNLSDYILEANRVLKDGGMLKIAEVTSRFPSTKRFIDAVCSMGFRIVNQRQLSTMFYLMDFKKVKSVSKTSKAVKPISLNACLYKKR